MSPANGSGNWTVTKAEHWIFEGTGMKNGDAFLGLVGWEHHGAPEPLTGLEVIAAGKTLQPAGRLQFTPQMVHLTLTRKSPNFGNFATCAQTTAGRSAFVSTSYKSIRGNQPVDFSLWFSGMIMQTPE